MSGAWKFLIAGCLVLVQYAAAADWPAFRGPRGDGKSEETGFPVTWSRDQNVRWRTPLPGPGNGSPIVVAGKVLVLCAEEGGKKRSTLCFDRQTGQKLWQQTVEYLPPEETHKTNPHCSSTPASDGKFVYVWHRSAGMHCYTLNGEKVWSRDLGKFEHVWGEGSSPLLYKDLVIQLCGPGERTFVIALNKQTGETVWESPVEPGGSASDKGRYVGTWSTPVMISVEGQDQILGPLHDRVVSYLPANGAEAWTVSGISGKKGDLVYTSPVVADDIAVVMGGFNGPALGFKLGGSGDTTDQHRLWHNTENSNPQRIGSGVIIGKVMYMANSDDAGSIECLDPRTGKQIWGVRRTPEGPHWGSMVTAGDLLYVTGQKGITRVMKVNPEKYEVVSENDLGEQSNSTPALSDGEIFLRTWEALYCVGK